MSQNKARGPILVRAPPHENKRGDPRTMAREAGTEWQASGTAKGQNNFEDLFSSGVPSASGVGGSGGGSGNGGGGGWRLESFRGTRRRLTGVWHRVGSEQL